MSRPVLGPEYVQLGEELRRVRKAAGKGTSEIPGYSASHVSLAERGMTHVSQDFVEVYIGLGGNRSNLLALYRQARESRDDLRNPTRGGAVPVLTPDSPSDELAKCYRLERAEDTYHFAPTGAVQLATNIVQVHAVRQSARFFPIFASYGNDERPGVITVEAGVGCNVVRLAENNKGHVLGVLELDETLTLGEGEPYTFSYSVRVHSDVPCKPFIRNHVRDRLAHHALRLRFVEPAVPSRLWWFRGPHHTDSESEWNDGRTMPIAGDNFYFRDFRDLQQEYWGIAWNWTFSV